MKKSIKKLVVGPEAKMVQWIREEAARAFSERDYESAASTYNTLDGIIELTAEELERYKIARRYVIHLPPEDEPEATRKKGRIARLDRSRLRPKLER